MKKLNGIWTFEVDDPVTLKVGEKYIINELSYQDISVKFTTVYTVTDKKDDIYQCRMLAIAFNTAEDHQAYCKNAMELPAGAEEFQPRVFSADNPWDKIIVPQQHYVETFLVVPTSFCMGYTGNEKNTENGLCIWYSGLSVDGNPKNVIEPINPELKRKGLISAFSGYIPKANMGPLIPKRIFSP